MLISSALVTFAAVARAGSFNKAAEELKISPPAVQKQINLLEGQLGLRLFIRTHRGLRLTEAGASLERDASRLLDYAQEAVARARLAEEQREYLLRLGTSPMTPSQFLLKLWPKVHQLNPKLQVQLVPFENTPENAVHILENLGQDIDLVAGYSDQGQQALYSKTRFRQLTWEPLRCAVASTHPLAAKKRLTLEALYGQRLYVLRRNSTVFDDLRRELTEHHPAIELVDFPFYDMKIFNRCVAEQAVLVTIDPWSSVHPLLKTLPVDWDYTIPYGILYSPRPSKGVREFLEALDQIEEAGDGLQP